MITHYKRIALVVCGVAATLAYSLRPSHAGSLRLWLILLAGYACLALWAAMTLHRQGDLRPAVRVRSGDLTAGILTGLVTMGAGLFVLRHLAPVTSPRGAWLYQLYTHAGDVHGDSLRTLLLLGVVVLEELVWRGFVQHHVQDSWGSRLAVPVTAALYALAHVPTLFVLAGPGGSLNPLLVLGAFGFGLVWGFLTLFTGRLLPAVMCHAVVSYFLVAPAPTWLF